VEERWLNSLVAERPGRLHLPSGIVVAFDAPPPSHRLHVVRGAFARDARAFRGSCHDAAGRPVELAKLSLGDFHVLRALLRRLGELDEKTIAITCNNCRKSFAVTPCKTLELGPFRDGELDDAELDKPFDFERLHELDGQQVHLARLEPRSLLEAEPLHRAVSGAAPLSLTAAVVRGMGLVELDSETDPARIAERLSQATDADFDAVGRLFEGAHYSPRLLTRHVCPSCGAAEWVEAPALREFSVEPAESSHEPRAHRLRASGPAFMKVSEFEALVRVQAERTYRNMGVRAIDLLVVEEAAECDDAGEPLLGCYRPGDPEALPPEPPEIRLFYRTFESSWLEDGPYDVAAEIEETLEHELEHHLGFLAGHDPLDEEEHAEIDAEVIRRVGRKEAQRRAFLALGGDVRDFFVRTWWLWLLALAGTLIAFFADR
jgi:hypothetical protein